MDYDSAGKGLDSPSEKVSEKRKRESAPSTICVGCTGRVVLQEHSTELSIES